MLVLWRNNHLYQYVLHVCLLYILSINQIVMLYVFKLLTIRIGDPLQQSVHV